MFKSTETLRLYERRTFKKNASGVKLIGISFEYNEVHYEACLRGVLNKGLFNEVQKLK